MELPVDFTFTASESETLRDALLSVDSNPYVSYDAFCKEIDLIIDSNALPLSFIDFSKQRSKCSNYDSPFVRIKNCPIDIDIPFLDFDTPVIDKRDKKKTFVSEGFLQLYAVVFNQKPIGYINVNDGDIFQDIHPMRKLAASQSQKALNDIYFHKDLTNHFVRPDWVNIIGLRSDPKNEVLTCFVKNKDVLDALSYENKTALKAEEFHTPYDDLTVASGNRVLGDAPPHRVLGGGTEYDLRFFEKRTVGLTERAVEAVTVLTDILHRLKKSVFIGAGDFVGSANNESIHCKQLGKISNEEALKSRWLMKTVNVRDLSDHSNHFIAGSKRVVNG